MRIIVDDVAAQYGGALSVLTDFDEYIKSQDNTNEWFYLLSGHYIKERKNTKVLSFPNVKRSWFHRIIFDFFTTKKLVNKLKPDIFLSLQNTLPFGVKANKKILYVHQSIPFQKVRKFSFLKKNERFYAVIQYFLGFLIKLSIKHADKIIVQTEWMKKAVINISPKSNVIKITPKVKVEEDNKALYSFDSVHFFYPTSDAIYKNIELIEKACTILDKKELCYSVDITVKQKSNLERKISDKINFLGRIDRAEVFKRYRSSVLIFPSYIETFGYPLVEARACGSYILASDCEFSHELLNDYENVSFFDPFSVNELVVLMEKIITKSISINNSNCKKSNVKCDDWSKFYHSIV